MKLVPSPPNKCLVCNKDLLQGEFVSGYNHKLHRVASVKEEQCDNYSFDFYHEYTAHYDFGKQGISVEEIFVKNTSDKIYIVLNYEENTTSISKDRRQLPVLINGIISFDYSNLDQLFNKLKKYILFY